MNKKKLLAQIQNSSKNVRYGDFVTLIEAFEFRRKRGKGSHEIYGRQDIPEIVNIQNRNGYAKSYQVDEFLSLIEKYNFELED